jgi:hypothetical protein
VHRGVGPTTGLRLKSKHSREPGGVGCNGRDSVAWDEGRCLVDTDEGRPGADMSIGS